MAVWSIRDSVPSSLATQAAITRARERTGSLPSEAFQRGLLIEPTRSILFVAFERGVELLVERDRIPGLVFALDATQEIKTKG